MGELELLTELSPRQVATFTLNRPDVGNACDTNLLTKLAAALEDAGRNASVRVIVLRGAGRHFCSGVDIHARRPSATGDKVSFFQVCRMLDEVPKPTVAVVHGGCIGGGVAMAACCDVVLADREAFFSFPEVRLGLAPGPLSLYFIRGIGVRSLRRYLLTGERFSASTACQFGLVHSVFPSEELEGGVEHVVDSLLLGAPGAIGRAKALLATYGETPVTADMVEKIESGFREQAASSEAHEGRMSFRDKRKPTWYPRADRDESSDQRSAVVEKNGNDSQ